MPPDKTFDELMGRQESRFAVAWIVAAAIFVPIFARCAYESMLHRDTPIAVIMFLMMIVWGWAGWVRLKKHFLTPSEPPRLRGK